MTNQATRLAEEVKRLAAEYAHVYSFVGDDTMPRKQTELHAAIDALAALAQPAVSDADDAARYRFLRDDPHVNPSQILHWVTEDERSRIDAAVDSARASSTAGEGK